MPAHYVGFNELSKPEPTPRGAPAGQNSDDSAGRQNGPAYTMGNERSGSYSRCCEENLPGVECRREARSTKTTLGHLSVVSGSGNTELTQPGGALTATGHKATSLSHTQPIHISHINKAIGCS